MVDVHDSATRSYNMSKIRSGDTKPEMLVRKFLHHKGLRFSLHNKKLTGKPDLTLKKYNTTVFINGCFWHGHKNCKYFVLPKTRTDWWQKKINKTMKRDFETKQLLTELGWNTFTIWECELKPETRETTLNNLYYLITGEQG